MCSRAASQSNFGGGGIFWNREGEVHWFLILISVPNRLPYIHVCLGPNPPKSFPILWYPFTVHTMAILPGLLLRILPRILCYPSTNSQAIEPSHISSGILLQSLHTVRNTAFMSNTLKVGCLRPKHYACFPVCVLLSSYISVHLFFQIALHFLVALHF